MTQTKGKQGHDFNQLVMIPSLRRVLNVCPGGRGQIKQKKKTVPQKVTIAKIPRAKKKYVTRVCGLATFGKA